MPELSRFFGITIRMHREVGESHSMPHFHAHYQDHVAVCGVYPVEIIAGWLPPRQRRFVAAWAVIHEDELLENWNLLASGRCPRPVEPLG